MFELLRKGLNESRESDLSFPTFEVVLFLIFQLMYHFTY